MAGALDVDISGGLNSQLTNAEINRALRRGLDRGTTQLRRNLVKTLASRSGAKTGRLNQLIRRTKRTTAAKFSAEVMVSAKHLKISEMSPSHSTNSVAVRADFDVRQGRGKELLRKAFSPKNRRVNNDIFERLRRGGKLVGRYPIRRAFGPSPAIMVKPLLEKFLDSEASQMDKAIRGEIRVELLNRAFKALRSVTR